MENTKSLIVEGEYKDNRVWWMVIIDVSLVGNFEFEY